MALGTTIRVVVVDRDDTRGDIAASLAEDGDIDVRATVAAADDVGDAGPDVVVIGHRMPGGDAVMACELLRRGGAGPAVAVLASTPRTVLLRRVLQAGATAFVSADSPPSVLRDAVRSIAAGHPYLDHAVAKLVVDLVARTGTEQRPYGLTRAQLDVVALLPKGLRNREIAAELGITENTVKTHLRHALKKLNVRDRAQAAALVVREGIG